ncbi:MAG TPA: TetR/AcrR family transcriptional regulator [Acidimicrobiia bacterium]|nr:TetR/AcrR family transcriptional regulator [Acidimicrobiia bacterium]
MAHTSDPLTLRDRVLAATYRCVARFGLGKTTIDDVAKESGVSRATIYRQFPGGRDELLLETVGWELGNYFTQLADQVRDAPNLAELLRRGLVFAHRSVAEHAVLRKVMETEPERLLPLLTTEATKTLPFIADFLLPYLRREDAAGRLRPGVDLERAAEYLARTILSLIGAPGRWDLDDPEQVAELVRDELLGGIALAG